MFDALADSPLLLCLAAIATSSLASLVPASPAEPMLMAIAALLPRHLLLPMVVLATLGAMTTKLLVYLGGASAQRAIPERHRARVDALAARLDGRGPGARRAVILASALFGLPPFYVVTLLWGALRLPLREWLVAGCVGRAVRLTCLVVLPHFVARAW